MKTKMSRTVIVRMTPSFRRDIIDGIDEMEHFKNFTLDAIKNEKKSIQQRFDKHTKNLTEEEIINYCQWNSEDYFLIDAVFKTISLYSFIVIFYSYIENSLNTLCNAEYTDIELLHKKEGKPSFNIRYIDMKGVGIQRAKLYLEKVIGIDFHVNKRPWSEVNTLRKIRNVIVHNEGYASSDDIEKDDNIIQHIKHGRLEITDHGHDMNKKILIKPEYLDFILSTVRIFFKNIERK